MAGLANHLWQSTLFAIAAAIAVAALRGNRAAVRHWIWVIASVKWLVPFAWLMAAGSAITGILSAAGVDAAAPPAQPTLSIAVLQFTEPFHSVDLSAPVTSALAIGWLVTAIIGVWTCGVLALVAMRLRSWFRIRAAIDLSAPLDIGLRDARLDVRSAPGVLEPGIVGIWRPIMLLPSGIHQALMPEHLESVIAHELCHVRRRDNLTAAVHMVVEALFWFHPVVWWIGARLVEERERACDEFVLTLGAQPRDYAEGILRVCKLYVESPIACVSGVTGSNLKRRIEDIMRNRIGQTLTVTRKVILTAAAAFVLAAPVAVGALALPVRGQSAPPVAGAASPQKPAVGDLTAVFKVVRDPNATAADKERLIGKAYSGSVKVDAIRLYPQAAIVMALPDGTAAVGNSAPTIVLAFTGKTDDEKLQQLRKGENARLRGTLTKFRLEGKILWLDFADLVIEERRP